MLSRSAVRQLRNNSTWLSSSCFVQSIWVSSGPALSSNLNNLHGLSLSLSISFLLFHLAEPGAFALYNRNSLWLNTLMFTPASCLTVPCPSLNKTGTGFVYSYYGILRLFFRWVTVREVLPKRLFMEHFRSQHISSDKLINSWFISYNCLFTFFSTRSDTARSLSHVCT